VFPELLRSFLSGFDPFEKDRALDVGQTWRNHRDSPQQLHASRDRGQGNEEIFT
jgi:hypothetical protein